MNASGTPSPPEGRKTWWSQAADGSWRRWDPVAADWQPAEGPPPPDEALAANREVVRNPWKAAEEGTGFGDYLRTGAFLRSLVPRRRVPQASAKLKLDRFWGRLLFMGGVLGLVSFATNALFNQAWTDAGVRDPGTRSDNWQLLVFAVVMFAGSFAVRQARRRQRP
jgi:hypothetical protein